MFPKIETITDILPHIKDQKDIRVKVKDNGFTIICYMMQGGKTFSGDNSAFALECRGITFRPDGKIATRPMQKFFNVGETVELASEKNLWEDVSRVMIKRDGSKLSRVG